jgi:hypothetical protein
MQCLHPMSRLFSLATNLFVLTILERGCRWNVCICLYFLLCRFRQHAWWKFNIQQFYQLVSNHVSLPWRNPLVSVCHPRVAANEHSYFMGNCWFHACTNCFDGIVEFLVDMSFQEVIVCVITERSGLDRIESHI